MIIQLQNNLTQAARTGINADLKKMNFKVTEVTTRSGDYLVCRGKNECDIRLISTRDGILNVYNLHGNYELVSRKWKADHSCIDVGDGVVIGGEDISVMAGPCSIESEEQIHKTIAHLKENNITIMRGGVFKPRSSPYHFRGLGIDALKLFSTLCKEHGIKIISEVMQVSQIEEMCDYVDIFQVGARNSQNFNLLEALGGIDKPVMLKRGTSGTIEELLQSAEYIFTSGNEKIILCERGIRTYETAYRNTFDINAIQVLKDKSHLPVVADTSHGVGVRDYVGRIALASVVAGADGVMYEVHETPEEAVSDGAQTLNFEESSQLCERLKKLQSLKGSCF